MGLLNDLTQKAYELKGAGKTEEALAAFRAIIDVAPTNPALMHNLAGALADAGRHKEAIEWGRRAVAAGIIAPETWLLLARSEAALGMFDDAQRDFVEALNRRPTDAVAHKELAQLIWMLSGDRDRSLRVLNTAIAALPAALDLRIIRAQVIGQTGDAKGEYQEVLAALKLGGGKQPMLDMAAANSALAAGEYKASLSHARAAAALLPNDINVAQSLCRALLAVGEPLEASRLASRFRAQFPLDQFYVAIQALAWRLLGDDRYHELFNYERFVAGFPLAKPAGWKSAEQYIDDLIEALDRHHQYKTHPFGQSVRHGSQLSSLTDIDDPVLKAVSEAVHGPITSYIARLGVGRDPLRIRNRGGYRLFSIWSIRLASSGYHINHVHPQGWLSSASHLRFPEAKDAEDKSGWLTFGEPGVPTTPTLGAEYFVRPQKGVMVVFPSYMWHGTVPFSGETTRLTIAADSVPAAI